ncbi:LysR substrate-binding domain-containing protein [Methylobrevis pamukkalensis]|uniref:HTH-type transcriptional regulator CysL n=1 Tax=Methylobrevis pamukkalensis TaxID=1439726 RepID=A0A1E3H6Q6_9HYPH|nr:LysR substrate-binding domain-containing protein [Methylobrevis pamukkalensis]ODN72003.1 HTH-type transcriptional regulator CysL [Methylobrevis pamukkalensis]
MTFEQLTIFVAVAEREHVTQAAAAIGLTPSAVSASVKALEAWYGVRLFERVGRRIELTRAGRTFLAEARATLARVRAAEMVLSELGGLVRGVIDIHASQTIANYWLPPRLLRFRALFPGIEIRLATGNTRTVAEAVVEGTAEIGLVEGAIDVPVLSAREIARDELVVVAAREVAKRAGPVPDAAALAALPWVLREPGSGTRSAFEVGMRALGLDPSGLDVALTLPSNEAVLTAVRAGGGATALSRLVAAPFVATGDLETLDVPLPPRSFLLLRHRERGLSAAAMRLAEVCGEEMDGEGAERGGVSPPSP